MALRVGNPESKLNLNGLSDPLTGARRQQTQAHYTVNTYEFPPSHHFESKLLPRMALILEIKKKNTLVK